MTDTIRKLVVVPIDGSDNSLKALDYLRQMFGSHHDLKLSLVYFLPKLPPILLEESRKDPETRKRLLEMEEKNTRMAEGILETGVARLMASGFPRVAVEAVHRKTQTHVARDICNWAEGVRKADAVMLSSRGRSRLEAFFTGETANKVLEQLKVCPIWMVKGTVQNKDVLLAVDNSENAMRAVDHAGFLLSGTEAKITLFHSKRDLRQFVPKEVLKAFPEVQKFWQSKAGETVAPYMAKAHKMLVKAGVAEGHISVRTVEGSRSSARDILQEAEEKGAGTIILGRKGDAADTDYSMGSTARKVLDGASDTAVCIVP